MIIIGHEHCIGQIWIVQEKEDLRGDHKFSFGAHLWVHFSSLERTLVGWVKSLGVSCNCAPKFIGNPKNALGNNESKIASNDHQWNWIVTKIKLYLYIYIYVSDKCV